MNANYQQDIIYYEGLYESLLSYTEDDYNLLYFDPRETVNKVELEMIAGFTYRCLKCGILEGFRLDKLPNSTISNIESLALHMSTYSFYEKFSNADMEDLNMRVWFSEYYWASDLTKKLAEINNLTAYEDSCEPKKNLQWTNFKNQIEKTFLDYDIGWNQSDPILVIKQLQDKQLSYPRSVR